MLILWVYRAAICSVVFLPNIHYPAPAGCADPGETYICGFERCDYPALVSGGSVEGDCAGEAVCWEC
jgi:hypothetical protein